MFNDESIHFLGLGVETGQRRPGLSNSAKVFRDLYHKTIQQRDFRFFDHGDFASQIGFPSDSKIYYEMYLKGLNLQNRRGRVVNWGGDHSVGISTVAAFKKVYPEGVVLWIDAHADLNTVVESLTGNLHGMPLAALTDLDGFGQKSFPWINNHLSPKDLLYFGLRSIDPFEEKQLKKHGIKAFRMKEIRSRSVAEIISEIMLWIGERPLHISFDIDSVDPRFAPSTGLHEHQGIWPQELYALGKAISFKKNELKSIDIVEINPSIGSVEQVHETYEIAFKFLTTVLNLNEGVTHVSNHVSNQRENQAEMEWNLQI